MVSPSVKTWDLAGYAKLIFGDSAFRVGLVLSYPYFALGVSFVRLFWRWFRVQNVRVRKLALCPKTNTVRSGFEK